MATNTATYPGAGVDAEGAIQTAINASSGDDIALVPTAAGSWSCKATNGAGVSSYSFTLKGGTSGHPVIHTFNGDVIAKAGSFLGTRDSLIGCDIKSNVTINGSGSISCDNMIDANDPDQYRHLLQMRGSTNVIIDGSSGLRLLSADGGDALYIGPTELAPEQDANRTYCSNITVTDMVFSSAGRTGVGVISVDGLTVSRCQFLDTVGTPTQAGILLEPEENTTDYAAPDQHKDRIANVVIEDCVARGNASRGYLVAPNHMMASHTPISVTIRRCRNEKSSQDTDHGFDLKYDKASILDGSGTGTIKVHDCMGEGMKYPALHLSWRLDASIAIDVRNFRARNCGLHSNGTERGVQFEFTQTPSATTLRFRNLIIEDKIKRTPIAVTSPGGAATNVLGDVRMVTKYWPVHHQRSSLLPNLKIGRFGRLQFSNSKKSRRSVQRGER